MASNLFQYYSSKGTPMPTLSSRGQLYQQYGLGNSSGYVGTAEQNTALLNALQSGQGSTPAAPAPAPAAAPAATSSDPYSGVIDTYKGELGGLDSTYAPMVSSLQAGIPDIQKKYSDMLAQLGKNETNLEGSAKQSFAASGVASTAGSTPETSYMSGLQGNYAANQAALGNAQTQDINSVNSQIASLLAQKETARQNINAAIAQTQAQSAAQAEQKREFDAQLAAQEAAAKASSASSGLDIGSIISSLLGGTGSSPATTSSDDMKSLVMSKFQSGRWVNGTEQIAEALANPSVDTIDGQPNPFIGLNKDQILAIMYPLRKPFETTATKPTAISLPTPTKYFGMKG